MNSRQLLYCLCAGLLLAGCATSGGGSGTDPAAVPASAEPAGVDSGAAAGAEGSSDGSRARADGSADPGVPAKTSAERRADIDGQLDASLESFDEKLRNEQQRTASDRDAQAAARADGAVVDATSSGESDRDEIRRDRSGDLKSDGVQSSGGGGGGAGAGASGSSAKAIPSGVDDDIIARRLRRAAENETDPELQEKLWDEYRDYKENTQGSK